MPPQFSLTFQQNETFCIGKDLLECMLPGLMHLHRYDDIMYIVKPFKDKSAISIYCICASLVGDYRGTLSIYTISCIRDNYISNDRIFLDCLQGVLVLLLHVLHIVVLQLYGNDGCFNYANISGSCNSAVLYLHYV